MEETNQERPGNTEEDWKIFEILCKDLDVLKSAKSDNMEPDFGHDVVTSYKSEIAGLQYKKERLTQETNELKNQMLSRDQRILEQQVEIDHLREQSARQNAIISSLKNKIHDLEENQRNLYSSQSRHEIAYQNLQRECRFLEEKTKDYEKKLRNLEMDCTTEEQQKEHARHQLYDIVRQLSLALGYDCCDASHLQTTDNILIKATELIQETSRLKTKYQNAAETSSTLDQELRSCRDLLERSNSEKDSLHRQNASQMLEIERLKQDKESLSTQLRIVERELHDAKERLNHSTKNISSITDNLSQNEALIMQLKENVKQKEDKFLRIQTEFRNTLDSIAILLSLPSRFIEAQETSIKERIRELLSETKEKSAQIEHLRDKLSSETQHYQRVSSAQEQSSSRLRILEEERKMLEAKVHSLEDENSHLQAAKDSLRRDKANFVTFLERLGRTLNMDELTNDVGIEIHCDAILQRAEQLSRLESDKIVDKTAAMYQLQRRIRILREQIQRKDLHLDLMRRKLSVQEENFKNKTILQAERDEALVKIKKLNKQIDKLTLQLAEARSQLREQNAELADAAEFKIQALERARKIDDLQKRLTEAEILRNRYNHKVNILKEQVKSNSDSIEQERNLCEHQISMLKEELTRAKEDLASATRREAQLTSFRNSIAKLLGILVPTSVSDLEMISRLQKLIDAHHDFTVVSRRYDDPALLRASSRSPPPSRCRTRTPDRSLRYDDSGYADPGYDIDSDRYKTRSGY